MAEMVVMGVTEAVTEAMAEMVARRQVVRLDLDLVEMVVMAALGLRGMV